MTDDTRDIEPWEIMAKVIHVARPNVQDPFQLARDICTALERPPVNCRIVNLEPTEDMSEDHWRALYPDVEVYDKAHMVALRAALAAAKTYGGSKDDMQSTFAAGFKKTVARYDDLSEGKKADYDRRTRLMRPPKRHVCPKCGKKFYMLDGLREHNCNQGNDDG